MTVAAVLTPQEKVRKALKEIKEIVSQWAFGKITHESAMKQVADVVKKEH